MEERTQHLTPPTVDDVPEVDATGPQATAGPPAGAQIPLPFDDEAERPIPFALTARARRTVAPDALPSLRVVPGVGTGRRDAGAADDDTPEDPSDTRPARARALRRAGVARADIAAQLGVDDLLVRAWTSDVHGPARPRRVATAPAAPAPVDRSADDRRLAEVRSRARDVAIDRLRSHPQLGAGLGVLAGTAEFGRDAVIVTTRDPRIAAAVVRWLVDVLGADPADVRVVLRVPPRAAADVARHTWSRAVDVDPIRIRTTSAGAPIDADVVEAVLRIVDADLAATAAGWCDALLTAPTPPPAF